MTKLSIIRGSAVIWLNCTLEPEPTSWPIAKFTDVLVSTNNSLPVLSISRPVPFINTIGLLSLKVGTFKSPMN